MNRVFVSAAFAVLLIAMTTGTAFGAAPAKDDAVEKGFLAGDAFAGTTDGLVPALGYEERLVGNPSVGSLVGEDVGDVYVFVAEGSTTVQVDTIATSSAADLMACISRTPNTQQIVACGDDNVACSHPPASGYACPRFTANLAPGVYFLLIDRWNWIDRFGEPLVAEYVAGMASTGALATPPMLLLVDDGPENIV